MTHARPVGWTAKRHMDGVADGGVWWCARGTAVTGQGQALICAPVSVVVRSGCPARCSTWHVLTAPCASSRGALARAARSQEVEGPTCA